MDSGDTVLTPKQERFCLAYLETGNASQAYRLVYDAKGMKSQTVNRKAKELLDNGKITARLNELRRPAVEAAQITLEGHLAELQRLKTVAESSKVVNVALRAEELRGRAAGLYVDRKEVRNPLNDLTDEQLDRVIASLAGELTEDERRRLGLAQRATGRIVQSRTRKSNVH